MQIKFSRAWAFAHGGYREEFFAEGQEIEATGDLAAAAISEGAAVEVKPDPVKKARRAAPENAASAVAPETK